MKEVQNHAAFVHDQSFPTHRTDEEPSDSSPFVSSDQTPAISALQECDEESDIRQLNGLIERPYNCRKTNWLLRELAVLIISVLLALIMSMIFPNAMESYQLLGVVDKLLLIGLVNALRNAAVVIAMF
jgi:hypothetical protein